VSRFFSQVLQILKKDLRVEWRSREIVYTMALFSVLVVVIFSFAFSAGGAPRHDVAGGVLWVAIVFSGTLGLSRIFEREREGETITALLLSPTSRAAIYLGKLIGTMIYMAITEVVVVPLLIMLFGLQFAKPGLFILLVFLGTLGFAAVGSLFAATLMRVRSREVLLGILTFPIVTPVIVAGTKGTAALMATPADPAAAMVWLKLVTTFDLVFVFVSFWAFGPLVSSD